MEIPNLGVPGQPQVPAQGDGNTAGIINAPASPPSPEGIISQDQMRTNLQDLNSKIQGKFQDFNSQKFSSDNQLKEMKGNSMRSIFELFESFGVDPSNAEEVRTFLTKIKENNPEISQKLEELLSSIIGEDDNPVDQVNTDLPVGQ